MSKLKLNPEHELYEKAIKLFPKEIEGKFDELEIKALDILEAVLSPFDEVCQGAMREQLESRYIYRYYSRYGEHLNPLIVVEWDVFGDMREEED